MTTIDAYSPDSGRVTASRVVATLGVLGATAAIASLGTFGTFTDTTDPVDTSAGTGVLSVDVADAGSGLVPFTGGLMLPGDSRAFPVDLVNSGDTALSSVALGSQATVSSVLDTDLVNGLQLAVQSCSVAWTDPGSGFSCSGAVTAVYSGPIIVAGHALSASPSLAAGGVDHLLITASLPSTASADAFEGATSSLSFVFSGVQRDGAVR